MSNELLISDANILIDLEDGGISQQIFKLDYDFAVPDILFEEELKECHPELLDYGLKPIELTPQSISGVLDYQQKYQGIGVSTNDLFALSLAVQEQCALLTGDKLLRTVAEKEQVIVHGTLWLIEQLLLNRIITLKAAKSAYKKMREGGSRLPWRLVEKQLVKFTRK